MTATVTGTAPLTARAVLFGGDDGGAALGELDAGVVPWISRLDLGALSRSARDAVHRDTAAAAAGLLDLGLSDVILAGWRAHAELVAAGRRTEAEPGSRETVLLAAHRVTHRSQPCVDLLIGDTPLARITMTLEVVVDITGAEGSVRAGRLVALHAGQCQLTASLAIGEAPPISRTVQLVLPLTVPLGDGLRLTGEPAEPPPVPEPAPGE